MTLFERLLAAIGLHSVALSAASAGALEAQLWAAEHVVLASVVRQGTHAAYQVRKVFKGDAGRVRVPEGAAGSGNVLLFLGAKGVAAYPLDWRDRFVYLPDDPKLRGQSSISEVERILGQPPFDTHGCQAVTRHGEFVLCTEILHAGTRSQGRRGVLYRNGSVFRGERKGQLAEATVEGKTIRFVFLGEERPHLWSVSGWDLESNPRAPGE